MIDLNKKIELCVMKQELLEMLCRKSFKYSDKPTFKLVLGGMSRFYVNCKPVILNPRGMFLIGNLVFDAIKDLNVTAIGGLTFGADPTAVATAFASELNQKQIKAFSIRKTKKDHGVVGWIEGDIKPGDRVVIIDDVVTTGGSMIKAIERARSEGLNVVKAVILVDRQEGGIENIRKQVPDISAIISMDELVRQTKKYSFKSKYVVDLNKKIAGAPDFKYKEFVKSDVALRRNIINTPNEEQWRNIEMLSENVLQYIRNIFGQIRITSGFRSVELCLAIGSSKWSNHARGEAADFEPVDSRIKLVDIMEYIVDNLEFRTVILEYPPTGWLHCDYREGGNLKRIKLKDLNHNYETVSMEYIRKLYG